MIRFYLNIMQISYIYIYKITGLKIDFLFLVKKYLKK